MLLDNSYHIDCMIHFLIKSDPSIVDGNFSEISMYIINTLTQNLKIDNLNSITSFLTIDNVGLISVSAV